MTLFDNVESRPSCPRKREPGVFRTVPGDRSSGGGHCDTAGKEVVHEAGAEAMQLTEYNAICLQLMMQFRLRYYDQILLLTVWAWQQLHSTIANFNVQRCG